MEETLAFLLLIYGGSTFAFSQPAGETICLQKCASCHGMDVQSVKVNMRMLWMKTGQLVKSKHISGRKMPNDDPDLCAGEESVKVSQYVYQQFYSANGKV